MLGPLRLYGLLGAALAGVVSWGYVTRLRADNAALAGALAAERARHSQCLASLDVARADRERDNEIDRIPDHGLRDAAREWMLDAIAAGAAAASRP